MAAVTLKGYVHSVASDSWHSTEKYAMQHPIGARGLSIPIAIGTLIKHLFLPIAECVDHIKLAAKNLKNYTYEVHEYEELRSHLWKILECCARILISPVIGSYHAIRSLVLMLYSPVKAAKIEAAESDMHVLSDRIQTPFSAIENAFLYAAFQQFKTRVWAIPANGDIAQWHFLDAENSKRQIVHKMQERKEKFIRIMKERINDILHGNQTDVMKINEFKKFGSQLSFIEDCCGAMIVEENGRRFSDKDAAATLDFGVPRIAPQMV